jgi:hypothetical protein
MRTTWRIAAAMASAPVIFLSGCAPSRSQLTDLLQQNLIFLPDKNFESLPPEVKQKEIVFLGEVHNTPSLHEAGTRLAMYLASDRPVVYATEGCYGQHPFMESASLSLQPQPRFDRSILEFNSKQPPDRKILMTAVDLEHTIYTDKKETVCYLQELAGCCTSTAARETLEKEIPQLTATKTFDEVDAYLLNLKNIFILHFNTFSPENQEEILFSLDLLQASNRYYRYESARGIMKNILRPWDIRYKYFKKTIERAYQKAQKNDAIMLCRIGNGHVSLVRDCETRYFARDYSLTKGKVMAIQMIPLYEDNVKAEGCTIDSVVKELMKVDEYCYLPLKQLQANTKSSLKWSRYYPGGKPICDGLLFVKTRKKP